MEKKKEEQNELFQYNLEKKTKKGKYIKDNISRIENE